MEDWVTRALKRWPNVPALFGWLTLDRRGRWFIKGERITRPQIVETIGRNYAADEFGRWYFQNGPQRGYVQLEYTPLVFWPTGSGDAVETHTGLCVLRPSAAYIDASGALLIQSEHGPGVLRDVDLDWALPRLGIAGGPIEEAQLAQALLARSGERTDISLDLCAQSLPLTRLDFVAAPTELHFVRDPQPHAGERYQF